MSWSKSPDALIRDLRLYGEDELAERVARLSDQELQPIWERVEADRKTSATTTEAFVAATVHILEGKPRPVSRLNRRRRPEPLAFVRDVREHLRMWTLHGSYLEVCSLVVGYSAGSPDDRVVDDFQDWLAARYDYSELAFGAQILRQALPDAPTATALTEQQSARALALLFDCLEACLSEGLEPSA